MHKIDPRPRQVSRRLGRPGALTPLVMALMSAFPLHSVAATPPPPANAVPRAPTVGWRVSGTGAALPLNAANAAGGTDQTIDQTSRAGIYNWQSFDVGRSSSVTFNFQTRDSSALNRVTGSASPTQIFGSLRSQYANPDSSQGGMLTGGSIYLINANGILFGAGARVNVGSLIASTLDLTNADYLSGFSNSIGSVNPTFTWNEATSGLFSRPENFVRVDANAVITTASGGRVFLFARKVENAGTISTPDGQTVLAAGSEIFLQDPTVERLYASEANPLYPVVNGLLVEVGKGNGIVSNLAGGSIESARGNTTLVGMAVNQLGRISATTSVSQGGSVLLLARGGATGTPDSFSTNPLKRATVGGALTLGRGSSIEIAADTSTGTDGKPATSNGNAIFTASRVELAGKTIDIQSGASIVAHGGNVNVRAEAVPYYSDVGGLRTAAYDPSTFNGNDDTRLVIGDGARIDTSGTTTSTVSTGRNFVTTELIGRSDLRDAPLQRDGVLYRSRLTFDIRQNVPILGDTSAYRLAVQRTADELLARGGSISLTSTGVLETHPGSTLSVAGGQVNYTDALVTPSRLVGADGTRYTLDRAPVDVVYTAIEGSHAPQLDRWGVVPQYLPSQTQTGRLERGYVDGQAGGRLTVVAPRAIVDGHLEAATTSGVRQTTGLDARAASSSVSLGLRNNGADAFGSRNFVSSGLGTIEIGARTAAPDRDFWSDPLNRRAPDVSRISAATLDESGAGRVTVTSDGGITLQPGADIVLGPLATLDLAAGGTQGLTVAGGFRSEGGTFSAATRNLYGQHPGGPTVAGGITVQPGVAIDVSGDWVNRALDGPAAAAATAGGRVTLSSARALVLQEASRIDVSGGATVAVSGAVGGTSAGSVTLEGDVLRANNDRPSAFHLGADIRAQSLAGGGTLAVRGVDSVVVVAQPTPRGARDGLTPGAIVLSEQFFRNGAFTTYDVQATSDLRSQPGVSLAPRASNWILTPEARTVASGTAISSFLSQGQLPDAERRPVNLSLGAVNTFGTRAASGDLTLGSGSSITVDPRASVSLTAGLNLDLEGRIRAPGGIVTAALRDSATVNAVDVPVRGTFRVGHDAVIDVSGQAVLVPRTGLTQQGTVVGGGQIDLEVAGLNARLTPLEILSGAVINADGTNARLGVSTTNAAGNVTTLSRVVSSEGGGIRVVAREGGAVLAGTMHANGGGGTASAGSFSLSLSGVRTSSSPPVNLVDTYRIVVQDAPVTTANAVQGSATVSASTLSAGFADVGLSSQDAIRFTGDVGLSVARNLSLDAPLITASPQSRSVLLSAGSTLLVGSTPSVETPTDTPAIAGNTRLGLQAGLVEFYGTQGLQGFRSVDAAASSEIRFHGVAQGNTQRGHLSLQSDLVLAAPQVSVTSGSDFTVDAAGQSVRIVGGDATAIAPLSAGGALVINAREISTRDPLGLQTAGVLRAPFGSLTLNASENIDIAPGSLLSVSGRGSTVLYGSTVNGSGWAYNGQSFTEPTPKTVSLNGRSITVSAGATIDASGGGDLVATEFIAGPGGSSNVFAGGAGGAFAIVPTVTGFAPQDTDTLTQRDASGSTASAALGRQITIGAGGPVPAGTYAVLPARYALLADAFLVRPVASQAPLALGAAVQRPDGSVIVGGVLSDAGTRTSSLPTGNFQVATSAQARASSEVRESSANDYFAARALAAGTPVPRLPQDAGRIGVAASELGLKGTTLFDVPDAALSRVGELDISADRIRVVGPGGGAADGALLLDATDLNATRAGVLVLGGTRNDNGLTATAREVVIDNAGTPLRGADVVVLANDRIELARGAIITATGSPNSGAALQLSGDGALLRVSSDAAASSVRTGAVRAAGDLVIGPAAQLSGHSITAEATHATTIASSAVMAADSITLGANRIAAGDALPAQVGATTLVLTPALAAQLASSQTLTLRAFDGLDLYGTSDLGGADVGSLTIDAGALRVAGSGSATVRAGGVRLVNTSGSSSDAVAGNGSLHIVANGSAPGSGQVVIGPGATSISGVASTLFESARDVVLSGESQFIAAGDVAIRAAALQAAPGANATVTVRGRLSIDSGATVAPEYGGFGARLSVDAASIEQAGRIVLPSGSVTLHASSGDVRFSAGSLTDVAGRSATLDGVVVARSGGDFRAASASGNVAVDAGAIIDASAAAGTQGGASAGTVSLEALSGSVRVAGAVRSAASAGQGGGTLSIASANPVDLDALGRTLAASPGNFTEAIDIRNRFGDQRLDATGPGLSARHIGLSSDSGSLTVSGRLDASGAPATTITLASGNTLTVDSGATISAHGTGASGGEVQLLVGTGTAGTGGQVNLNGGVIDVSAGTAGVDGALVVRAARTADGSDVRIGRASGSSGTALVGARRLEVEAVRSYVSSLVDGALIARVNADNSAFAGVAGSNAAGVRSRVAGLFASGASPVLQLRAGVEIDQPDVLGELVVLGSPGAGGWNLTGFDAGGRAVRKVTGAPVNLTLRSAGDLSVQAGISDGFTAGGSSAASASRVVPSASVALVDGAPLEGGRIRLVGGADLSAADVMRTRVSPGAGGNVNIGADDADVVVRTTTGSIQIAAAQDVTLANHQAVVYTTGRPVDGAGYVGRVFQSGSLIRAAGATQSPTLEGGGSVSVRAGRDVVGAGTNDGLGQYASEWLWRGADAQTNGQATWWARYDLFRQGFATFGGGNTSILAGRDAVGVEGAAASSGYIMRDGSQLAGLQRRGGGDLTLRAGRDIVSGFLLEDAGRLSIHAGRDIVGPSSTDIPALQVLHGASRIEIDGGRNVDVGVVTSFGLIPGSTQGFSNPESRAIAGAAAGATLQMVAGGGDLNYRGITTTDIPSSTLADHSESTGADRIVADRALFAAPTGSVEIGTLIQSSGGSTRLDILAQRDVGISTLRVRGTDARQSSPTLIDRAQTSALGDEVFRDQTPIDTGSREPVRIIAAAGDARVADVIQVARPLRMLAGRDVAIDRSVVVQHQSADELSLIEAGRDIVLGTTNSPNPDIKIYGPGNLLVAAGRNIDLKTSGGLGALGNRENAALPGQSASITVLAGVSLDGSDYTLALARYFPLLGGAGVAANAADLVAQLAAARAGQPIPGLGSAAATTFAAAAIDVQIAQTRVLVGQAAFDATVLADARSRNAIALHPASTVDQQSANASFAALSAAEQSKVAGSALASAWATVLSQAQQRQTVMDIATARGIDRTHAETLRTFVAQQTGRPVASSGLVDLLVAFDALPRERQALFVNTVLISEIRGAGRTASSLSGSRRDAAYAVAYDALALVFPSVATAGNLAMGSSQIHTFQDSAVSVLTPRGGVNVGEVSTPAGTTPKAANSLGIVTAQGGDISVVVRDSVLVNQSRVFTVGKGDLLMWASAGDLDAGRGAKTITGAPAPVFRIDASGNFVIDTSGSFSGSGIAVLDADSTLDLYAPRGEINAGDAGIKSVGNAFFGAARFVGADNLSIGGLAVGAPPPASSGGATAGLSAVGQAASLAATQVNPEDSEDEKARKRRKRLNLILEFLGFGDAAARP